MSKTKVTRVFDDYTVEVLLIMKTILTTMLESSGRRMHEACELAGVELGLSFARLESIERDVRKFFRREIGIDYVEQKGKYLVITDGVSANALAIKNSLKNINDELLKICELKSPTSRRGTVKVAAILSIIHYLGEQQA